MTPELINQRFVELQKMETERIQSINQLQSNLLQAQADLNSINGAKLDCQYWLAQVAKANAPAFVPNGESQALINAPIPEAANPNVAAQDASTSPSQIIPDPEPAAQQDEPAPTNETVN